MLVYEHWFKVIIDGSLKTLHREVAHALDYQTDNNKVSCISAQSKPSNGRGKKKTYFCSLDKQGLTFKLYNARNSNLL